MFGIRGGGTQRFQERSLLANSFIMLWETLGTPENVEDQNFLKVRAFSSAVQATEVSGLITPTRATHELMDFQRRPILKRAASLFLVL